MLVIQLIPNSTSGRFMFHSSHEGFIPETVFILRSFCPHEGFIPEAVTFNRRHLPRLGGCPGKPTLFIYSMIMVRLVINCARITLVGVYQQGVRHSGSPTSCIQRKSPRPHLFTHLLGRIVDREHYGNTIVVVSTSGNALRYILQSLDGFDETLYSSSFRGETSDTY